LSGVAVFCSPDLNNIVMVTDCSGYKDHSILETPGIDAKI